MFKYKPKFVLDAVAEGNKKFVSCTFNCPFKISQQPFDFGYSCLLLNKDLKKVSPNAAFSTIRVC